VESVNTQIENMAITQSVFPLQTTKQYEYDATAGFPHKNSMATVCLSGQLPEKLIAIAEAGFKSVDIFEDDLLHFSGTVEDVGKLCQSLGLSVSMLQTFRDFEGTTSKEAFDKNMDR